MSSGSKKKPASTPSMDRDLKPQKESIIGKFSILLELAACDDLEGFREHVEQKSLKIDEARFWYGRVVGSKMMGFEARTPLMIAATYGSVNVLKYIVSTGIADVNKACGSENVTALHCAVAGGASSMLESVKILIDASADINAVDAKGNTPRDLLNPSKSSCFVKKKLVELILKGESMSEDEEEKLLMTPTAMKEGSEKKEYPIDVSLPDISNGIYSTDEFRMYSFKVKPCSRAYSHDWTECPFVHPGENARRRDPRKYPYSCVPCPEFRKGACQKGDSCEYAHGVFESWLHPSQYRTRLCKDETGCARKVCFFAHKPEELRPVYASTGSAIPSPRSLSVTPAEMITLSPLNLVTSPKGGSSWQNRATPPALQLPGSRLKAALNARDMDREMELLQQQQLLDELSGLSSPSRFSRVSDLKPTNLEMELLDPSLMSPLHGMSLTPAHLQSPTGMQMRNQLRASYPSTYGFDTTAAVAAAVMNSRSPAFSKRSQSFIDRSGRLGLTAATNCMSDWGSPSGKLDWGVQGDDLSKLKKSASFGYRTNNGHLPPAVDSLPDYADAPDVSWVNTLVRDGGSGGGGGGGGGVHDQMPSWMEQLYIEQEPMAA